MATIELPIRKEGLPFRALAVTMDLKGFLRLLNVQKMPDKWLGGIVDTQGNMVARIPDHDQHIGQPASEGWRRAVNHEGMFEFQSLEGDPVVAAAAPIHGGWAAVIAIKQSEVYAQVWRAVRWVSLCGAAIMLASLSFAWWIARGIREPVLQLGKMAPQMLRGGTVEIAAAVPEVRTVAGLLGRAAEDLRYGEERLQLALDAAEAGLWEADPRSGAFVASDRALALHGLAPGTFMTHEDALAAVHPDDRPLVEAAIAESLAGGALFRVEVRLPQSDGSLRWLMSKAALQTRREGPRLIGLVQDVTARKDAEQRQTFLLKLSDTLRPLSHPIEIQAEASRLLGEHLRVNRVSYAEIAESDFIVKKCYANGVAPFIGRYPIAAFGEALIEACRLGEQIAVDDVSVDPRFTDAERVALRTAKIGAFAGVMLIKGGEWLGAFGVNSTKPRNWTPAEIEIIGEVAERIWSNGERAKAESALRESEERFRALAMLSSDWYWEQDENFCFTEFSAGVQDRTGDSPDICVDRTRWELPTVGVSEEQWARHRGQLDRRETFRNFEFARKNDRGETIWISISGEPRLDKCRQVQGLSRDRPQYHRPQKG
jgi:PAS domain S-box-containing protein